MLTKKYLELAERISQSQPLTESEALDMARLEDGQVMSLLPGADFLRQRQFGKTVHLCTILNAKSGKCPEDCAFCSQSVYAKTEAPIFGLKSETEVLAGARLAEQGKINRYSVVTSGKGLGRREVGRLSSYFEKLKPTQHETQYCASLGVLDDAEMNTLRAAGITRYHHNLEASRSYYPEICTTHSYDERVQTILAAKKAGMSVCAGGIFGIGESDDQVVEMAMHLRELDVDSIPVNFLMPIEGTRLMERNLLHITPLRCLKIIAMFRYILPNKHVLVCGGRMANLKDLHSLVFYAGASGIMTGNYLTEEGRTLAQDLRMITDLGYSVTR